jgi:hypothetical protein
MADQQNPQIKYYFKEDTNQILVSGSDNVANTNALITSSKNPITIAPSFYNTKIVNFGVDTSYMVQNGAEFTSLIGGNVINSFSSVYVDNIITTSPIQVTGNISGIGPSSITLASTPVGNTYQILQITVVQTGSNWSVGETITITQATLSSNGFVNPTADLIITLSSNNINQYGIEIPIATDQELWVYKGYNTVGGDGGEYRYNPHLHRAYKAYIVVETGSGFPSNPWLPEGNPVNTDAQSTSGGDIPGKFLEKQLTILGNTHSGLNINPVSGSFQVFNGSRNIHPFVFTKYHTLSSPPVAGALFRLYREDMYSNITGYSFSTQIPPTSPPTNTLTWNTTNASTNNKVYVGSNTNTGVILSDLSSSYDNGKSGGKIKISGNSDSVTYDIGAIQNSNTGYYTLDVSNPILDPLGFVTFTNGQALDFELIDYPQLLGQLGQSQVLSANTLPQNYDPITLETSGLYSYTSSIFPSSGFNGTPASGSTQFGLYTDLDYYVSYNARVDSLNSGTNVRVYFTSSFNTSSYVDIPRGYNVNINALVGTLSQSGYNPQPLEPQSLNPDSTYNGNTFDIIITSNSRTGTPIIPPSIFSKRYESVYISYSSSISSSLDGLYVFNQLPQNDIQVTASMFITAWTGSGIGARYGEAGSEYGTAIYNIGEAGDGPTWPTASIRIYTGSYPNSVPSTLDNFVTQSEFRDANIHVNGLAITMSYLIPSQSISIKDCLSLSLAVSSGSANSASVENSLVVREYYLEFNTPTSSLQGDGLVPTFVENAFSGTYGFSNAPDCQPTLNNASGERRNKFIQEVDYSTGIYNPINFQSILSGSAQKSTVPESSYTQLASIFPRYLGSKTSANEINSIEGLINGFGTLPVIDYKTAYFAYCNQVLDPYPVVNNITQFNIKYLINELGDALQPNVSPYTALDVEGSWTPGGLGRVGINQISGSSQFDQINGLQPIYKVAETPIAVLWSQTGANTTASAIALEGAAGLVSTFQADFLSYAMQASGKNTNINNNNDKSIPEYNVLDQIDTNGLFTFSTSSRYGFISQSIQNQASSSIVSKLSPAPNPTNGANTNVSYASPGEFYFNEDYFAINPSPSGYNYLTGSQLSDIYSFNITAEFPTTVPQEYRTQTGNFWHRSRFNTTNVGNISMKLQYYNGSNWVDEKIVQNSPPTMRLYFPSNQTLNVDLAQSFGSNYAGLRNSDTQCYVQINPTNLNNSVTQQGLQKNNALYASFIFNLKLDPTIIPQANRSYRWVATQYYTDENIDPIRNKYNPTTKPENLGGGATPYAAYNGPYINATVTSQNSLSSNIDGALNAPYWDYYGAEDILELQSPNGNATYDKAYYQKYLPYTASINPQFPGGYEPIDSSIPAFNIPWVLYEGDEIRFQNSEALVYKIIEVIPPENSGDKLRIKLSGIVGASINKDFFLIRRYVPSNNTILMSTLFPYGSLKTEQRFVESNNILTENSGSSSELWPSSSMAIAEQSGSYITSIAPLSKKDNTPSGLLLPEFPTKIIDVSTDEIIKKLRDNKLLT